MRSSVSSRPPPPPVSSPDETLRRAALKIRRAPIRITSSETQEQSVGSGEKGRRKFSSTGGIALNWKLTFVAPHDPTDCPWVSEDVRIKALKRKLLFRKCAVDFIPANFFWVKCVRFLLCRDWDFWKRPSDFRRFPTICEDFRTLPKMSEDVPTASELFKLRQFLARFDFIRIQIHHSTTFWNTFVETELNFRY